MNAYRPIHIVLLYLAIIAVLAYSLVACRSTGPGFGKVIVPPEKRIPLQPSGVHQGEADTGELVVAYTYQFNEGSERELHIKGGVRRARFKSATVNVYLQLLDDTGLVIQQKILVASNQTRGSLAKRPRTFDTTLPIAPEATFIAFRSYTKAAQSRE